MAHGILAQSYMDLPGTPMLLATTIRYLIIIFNPTANFDFECFGKSFMDEGLVGGSILNGSLRRLKALESVKSKDACKPYLLNKFNYVSPALI
jgi:hypothetical protein